jgi:hypothetical protein
MSVLDPALLAPELPGIVAKLAPTSPHADRSSSAALLSALLEAAQDESPAALRRTAEALVEANAVLPLLLMVQGVERDAHSLAPLPAEVNLPCQATSISPAVRSDQARAIYTSHTIVFPSGNPLT